MKRKTTSDLKLRLRPFTVKLHRPYSIKGNRITIYDLRRGTRKTINTGDFEECFCCALDCAIHYLQSVGITVDGIALGKNDGCSVLLSKDWRNCL